jgi:hypothetical protein
MTVTDLIVVGGVLINIGIWYQTGRSNTKAIEKLTDSHETLSTEVVAQGKDISKIKGHLGINGDFQRGKRPPCLTLTP